eukprot:CAMPEP_0194046372 /NCGR_PEP_ID=MMETSP0009_2-20130614/21060_1 /TAXON_ID=210454 /ORGANISM="Grammatophora oceanica, Strain CCMP 410" /LENGTH=162 /DNA_ID=CAMNT_0038691633 /DNA_START=29 /DNA_END=517 /DNA_ORIENTATION=-
MKTTFSLTLLALVAVSTQAFTPARPQRATFVSTTSQHMFGGSGSAPNFDDPEEKEKYEKAAKAFGMSVDDYILAEKARMKITDDMANGRVSGGSDDIGVETDLFAQHQFIDIKLTEDGKAKGAETVATELAAAFKSCTEEATKGRAKIQQGVMEYVKTQSGQ